MVLLKDWKELKHAHPRNKSWTPRATLASAVPAVPAFSNTHNKPHLQLPPPAAAAAARAASKAVHAC